MTDKTFTFIKLATGGRLIVEAKNEKAARERCHLDPELWELEETSSPTPDSEKEEVENLSPTA